MSGRAIKRMATVVAMSAVGVFGAAGVSAAAGPPIEVIDAKDDVWGCFGDEGVMLPPHHCINKKSQGKTGIILVFPPDDRGPAEGVSDASADDRPCPHDPDSPDGTWWEPVPGLFVCHHKP